MDLLVVGEPYSQGRISSSMSLGHLGLYEVLIVFPLCTVSGTLSLVPHGLVEGLVHRKHSGKLPAMGLFALLPLFQSQDRLLLT
jgi:hypothetical protein